MIRFLVIVLFSCLAFLPSEANIGGDGYKDKFLLFHLDQELKTERARGDAYLFGVTYDDLIVVLDKYPITYGENGTKKLRRNDKKTPLGKYTITRSDLTHKSDFSKYGGVNISINYPNEFDKAANRTGYGIAIHGGHARPTLGCLRILDGTCEAPSFGKKNIRSLYKKIDTGTVLFVTENISKDLVKEPGQLLSWYASNYWLNLLEKEIDYHQLENELMVFVDIPGGYLVKNTIAPSQPNRAYDPSRIAPYPLGNSTENISKPIIINPGKAVVVDNVLPPPTIVSTPIPAPKKEENLVVSEKEEVGTIISELAIIRGSNEAQISTPEGIVRVSTSSVYGGKTNYRPANLMDGVEASVWIPETTDKKREIYVSFEKDKTVSKIQISGGYNKKVQTQNGVVDQWMDNARPAQLEITFADGSKESIFLNDVRGLKTYHFSERHTGGFLKIKVRSIHNGSRFKENLVISEIKVQ